jgi:predicted aspartyl protease
MAASLALLCLTVWAQETSSGEELPIERCDVLPVVKVKVAGASMRFLLDTGATTILNLKSFSSGRSKEIRVDSWKGTAATSAREVSVPEIKLGSHVIRDVKLPAIDLSPIGQACGGQIDGILGVDLLDQLGATIDLKHQVALLAGSAGNARRQYEEMERAMQPCHIAFDQGKAAELEECFDPEIVLYTPWGEFRGRKEVMKYLQEHFLKFAPNLRWESIPHDIQSFGDALWYSYDYRIEMPGEPIVGHGMAMCRRKDGRWLILNMHNSLVQGEPDAASQQKQ